MSPHWWVSDGFVSLEGKTRCRRRRDLFRKYKGMPGFLLRISRSCATGLNSQDLPDLEFSCPFHETSSEVLNHPLDLRRKPQNKSWEASSLPYSSAARALMYSIVCSGERLGHAERSLRSVPPVSNTFWRQAPASPLLIFVVKVFQNLSEFSQV